MPEIRSITGDDALTAAFVDLPWSVYKDDPRWRPPDRQAVLWALSPANPFHGHGEAHHFVARRGSEVVGRCSAMINRRHCQDGKPIGLVGFFEAVDEAAGRPVIQAALTKLRSLGCDEVQGPIQFSIWHGYRFMTKGFDCPRFIGEPYNPPEYNDYFAAEGFERSGTWTSRDFGRGGLERMRDAGAAGSSEPFLERGYRVEPMSVARFEASMRSLYGLTHEGFSKNPGFSPIDFDEFSALFGALRPVLQPGLVPVLYHHDVPVGFAFMFQDPLSHQLVFWTSVIHERHRDSGVFVALLSRHALDAAVALGAPSNVGALVKPGSSLFITTGAPVTREYALFGRRLS